MWVWGTQQGGQNWGQVGFTLVKFSLDRTKHSAKGHAEAHRRRARAGWGRGKLSGLGNGYLGLLVPVYLWGVFPPLSGPQSPHL